MQRVPRFAFWIGLAALVAATAWWAVVFSTVWRSNVLSGPDVVVCLASSSGLCSLASALCSGSHFLNIRWYDPSLFWAGFGVFALGVFGQTLRNIPS